MINTLRITESATHRFPLLYVFRGDTLATVGPYLLSESQDIFGNENVASNLLEISAESDFATSLKCDQVDKLVQKLTSQTSAKLTIVEVLISSVGPDIALEYSATSVNGGLPYAVRSTLETMYGFNIIVREAHALNSELVDRFPDSHVFRLILKRSFIQDESKDLRPKLAETFSKDRYSTVQIPVFLLTTLMSGFADGDSNA